MIKLPSIGTGALISAVAVYMVLSLWNQYKPAQQPVNQWQPAPQIREVVKIKRVTVPGPERIVTIEKEKIVEKLKLPDEVAKNPNVQIIATAEVQPHRARTDVVATLDTKTGEASIITKPRKLPFFAFIDEREIGARYGVTTNGGRAVDIYGRWDLLRIAGVNIGLYAEAGTSATHSAEVKAQINVSYKF